jgi:hypothetical protein
MKKELGRLIVALGLLLPCQSAFANCTAMTVQGAYHLVGTLFKSQGVESYTFYCSKMILISQGGLNVFSSQADCTAASAGASGDFTISTTGANVIKVNPKTCAITGKVTLTHAGQDFTATILTGQLDTPAAKSTNQRGQFVIRAAKNEGIVSATIIRLPD